MIAIVYTAKGRWRYREARALAVEVGDEIVAPLERSQLTATLERIIGPRWRRPRGALRFAAAGNS